MFHLKGEIIQKKNGSQCWLVCIKSLSSRLCIFLLFFLMMFCRRFESCRARSRTRQWWSRWTTAVTWTWTPSWLKCELSMRTSRTAAEPRLRRGTRLRWGDRSLSPLLVMTWYLLIKTQKTLLASGQQGQQVLLNFQTETHDYLLIFRDHQSIKQCTKWPGDLWWLTNVISYTERKVVQ